MSATQTTNPTAGASPAAAVSRRRAWRWWLVGGGVVLTLVGAAGLWPSLQASHYLNAARQSLDRGDPNAALAPLLAATQTHRRRAEVQYLLAVAYRRAGQVDRFRPTLQHARELGWPAADVERQEWLALAQLGEVDAVRDRLMKIVDGEAPDEAAEEIYEALARGHLTAYRLREAWKCLDLWLQWQPAAPQARLMRAYIQEQLEQFPAAIEDYRTALVSLPSDCSAHLKLAELLLRNGALDEAETHFQAAVSGAKEGDAVDALIGLARCAQRRGNADEAREFLQAALVRQPPAAQHAAVLAEMGSLLLKEGQTKEALAHLQHAVQLTPAEIPLQRSLATALTRAGQAEQAEQHFARARALEAKHNRVGAIQRALLEKPRDADLRCEAGTIFLEQGLTPAGLSWLQTALRCDPRHRRTHQVLAQYYAEAGEQTMAAHHRLLAADASPSP